MKKPTTDDWLPLVRTFRDVFEWALDLAADLSSDYPDVVDVVERVRSFLHARLAGRTASLAADDALLTLALLLGALEHELASEAPRSATEHWLASIRKKQLAKNT